MNAVVVLVADVANAVDAVLERAVASDNGEYGQRCMDREWSPGQSP